MRDYYNDDPSYNRNSRDNNAGYNDAYDDDTYDDYNDYDEYDDYDDYDDYVEPDIDEELDTEHKFRIAMNVFDLISMLIGLAVILVLTALLFSLFNWVQRDLSQSLSVITAPFR